MSNYLYCHYKYCTTIYDPLPFQFKEVHLTGVIRAVTVNRIRFFSTSVKNIYSYAYYLLAYVSDEDAILYALRGIVLIKLSDDAHIGTIDSDRIYYNNISTDIA